VNQAWISLFVLFGTVLIFLSSVEIKLKVVSFASFLGTSFISDASAFNVSPGAVLSIFFIASLLLLFIFHGKVVIPKLTIGGCIIFFSLYCFLISIFAPSLFGGSVRVIKPGAVDEGIRFAVPLAWSFSALAQNFYFAVVLLLILVAAYVAVSRTASLSSMVNFHLAVSFTVASLAILEIIFAISGNKVQIFNYLMGRDFITPREDRYALDQVLGLPFSRAQGIFGEPSYFSAYMTGVFGCLLFMVRVTPGYKNILALLIVSLGLLASLSTTSILGMGLIFLLVIFSPVDCDQSVDSVEAMEAITRKSVAGKVGWVIFLAFIVSLIISVLASDQLYNYIFGKLSDTDGYLEGNYSSGAERLYWDSVAFQAFLDSYGLGIGAGATRPNSFLLTVLSSFGVPGLIVYAGLLFFLLRIVYGKAPRPLQFEQKQLAFLSIGWFCSMMISVPDGLSFFYLWVPVGMLIGLNFLPESHQSFSMNEKYNEDLC
jgi:hypothetical protein